MKATLNRSAGIATIILLAGIGISGCSSPSNNAGLSETKVSQSATPETPAPEATPEKIVHTPSEVSSVVDSFFLTLDRESRAGLETVRNTPEADQVAAVKAAFPETLAFFSKDMDEDKAFQMIAIFSSFSTVPGSLTVTLPEEGVILTDDTAIVPGDKLVLTLDGKVLPKSADAAETSGRFDFSYSDSGLWEISGFEMGTGAEAKLSK